MKELPIAPGCTLDAEGTARQGERYALLGRSLHELERAPRRLRARFRPDVDVALLEEAVAVERGCCSFFDIDWDPRALRLDLSVADGAHAPALDAIAGALRAERRS